MLRYLILLSFFLTINNAEAIPFRQPSDEVVFGDGAVTAKYFEFNFGLGTNPRMSSTDGTGFTFNVPLAVPNVSISENNFLFGDGAASDKAVEFNIGASPNNPKIFWDNTASALSFTNDGVLFKKIGSGSGSGGGENFNNAFTADDNPNAEDGTTSWSNSGGTFDTDTTDPLEGEQSFIYTPSAQGNYVQGPLLNLNRDVFKGRSCQANIEYIGGDNNLSLRILDAGGDVFKEMVLPEHTISSVESLFFLCPSISEIAGDADLGQLRLRVENTGVSASPIIKFDKSYIGTLIGLTETTTPDSFSVFVTSGGATSRAVPNDWVTGNVRTGTGDYTLPLSFFSFNNTPNCQAHSNVTNFGEPFDCSVDVASDQNSIRVRCDNGGGTGSAIDRDFTLNCEKTGTDAKQVVQVYKLIPKVSENVNEFNANIDSIGNIVSQSPSNWIDNVVFSDTSQYQLNFVAGIFNLSPICNITVSSIANAFPNMSGISSSSLIVRTRNDTATNTAAPFHISCSKRNTDFKMPTVQPILVNQVTTRASGGVERGVCVIENNGTATFDSSDPDCWWIDSVANGGSGIINITAIAAGFKCVVSTMEGNRRTSFEEIGGAQISGPSFPQSFRTFTNDQAAATANHNVSIYCSKNK